MLSIITSSRKKNEKRIPIHPDDLYQIPTYLRKQIIFENNSFEYFYIRDSELREAGFKTQARDEILKNSDQIFILKPTLEDFTQAKIGATIIGWAHLVQSFQQTQIAIDRKLTIIALEEMYDTRNNTLFHTFYQNNILAGYCSVIHTITELGINPLFEDLDRPVLLLGYGNVGIGALKALEQYGFSDITVCTQRKKSELNIDKTTKHYQYKKVGTYEYSLSNEVGEEKAKLNEVMKQSNIIINAIKQSPTTPNMWLSPQDEIELKPGTVIIDISCDTKMGFSFANATSFDAPFQYINGYYYYSVDHSPNYMWQLASKLISKEVLNLLPGLLGEKESSVIQKATQVREGSIIDPQINSFQERSK